MRFPFGLPFRLPTRTRIWLGLAWFGRGRLHPGSRPIIPAVHPTCGPAQSSFFGNHIRVDHGDLAALALSHGLSSLTPTTRLLSTEADFQHHRSDRVFTDLWQSIRRLVQGLTQQAQRPGGRTILLRGRLAPNFLQNALAFGCTVSDRRTAPLPRHDRQQPFLVEAAHSGSD